MTPVFSLPVQIQGEKNMQDTVLQFFDRQMDAPCPDFRAFTD